MQFKKGDKIKFMQKIELANSNIPACSIWEVRDFTEDDYILEGPEGLAFLPFKFVEKYCEITPKKDKHNILHDLIQTDGSVDGEKLMEKLSNDGKKDNGIRPDYYKSSVGDVFDIANAFGLSFPKANSLKYILRSGRKDKDKEVEDLRKAITCLQRAIEILQKEK